VNTATLTFTLTFAFTAGMLASVNPCGFAMLPTFITYYLSGDDTSRDIDLNSRLLRALWLGFLTTVGFVVVFVIAGSVLSAGGRVLIEITPWFGVGVGLILVLLGIWYLIGNGLPLSISVPNWDFKTKGAKGMFLYGVAYALVSLSCTLPIFLSVFAGSLASKDITTSITSFFAYSFGMGTVITTLALATALFQNTVTIYLRKTMKYVKMISASTLIITGIYLIYYQIVLNPFLPV
jgi:cytochrome c biogenesis protein CcdA